MEGIYPEKVNDDFTYFNYFTFRGNKYCLNTIVKSNKKILKNAYLLQVVEHIIDNHGMEFWTYAIWNWTGNVRYFSTSEIPDCIIECILEESTDPPIKQKQEYYSDSEVPGVIVGWILYITVMFFGMIFREFLILWFFATLFFMFWRKEKLKKPLIHDYGFDNVHMKVKELNERET